MTMWERELRPSASAPEQESNRLLQAIQLILHRAKEKPPGEEQYPKPKLPDWMSRRIGILFSRQGSHWVFLLFFEPIMIDDPNYEMTFTFRMIYHPNDMPEEYTANAHGSDGDIFFRSHKENISNSINFVITGLTTQKDFLDQLVRDIFWEWEEYFQYIRAAITNVVLATQKLLTW